MSNAERYRMFRDIEFDTEEFHALAAAFADFLKRKKIKNISDLRNRYRTYLNEKYIVEDNVTE